MYSSDGGIASSGHTHLGVVAGEALAVQRLPVRVARKHTPGYQHNNKKKEVKAGLVRNCLRAKL
jgi:hypothetical protein